jgi:hypothetical protein
MTEREPSADFDAVADVWKSVAWAYAHIRARVAAGGLGWRGWPESAACGRARNGDVESAEPRT